MNPKFRKFLIVSHRYLGYYFSGLLIAYCISGIAVNHIDSWNPNFSIERTPVSFSGLENPDEITVAEVSDILQKVDTELKPIEENIFYTSDTEIEIVLSENETLSMNLLKGIAVHERISKRPILHSLNFLHLNTPKKLWTWYADFFSISLIFITVSGMFLKRGNEGFWKKGAILGLAGMVPPFIFLLIY